MEKLREGLVKIGFDLSEITKGTNTHFDLASAADGLVAMAEERILQTATRSLGTIYDIGAVLDFTGLVKLTKS